MEYVRILNIWCSDTRNERWIAIDKQITSWNIIFVIENDRMNMSGIDERIPCTCMYENALQIENDIEIMIIMMVKRGKWTINMNVELIFISSCVCNIEDSPWFSDAFIRCYKRNYNLFDVILFAVFMELRYLHAHIDHVFRFLKVIQMKKEEPSNDALEMEKHFNGYGKIFQLKLNIGWAMKKYISLDWSNWRKVGNKYDVGCIKVIFELRMNSKRFYYICSSSTVNTAHMNDDFRLPILNCKYCQNISGLFPRSFLNVSCVHAVYGYTIEVSPTIAYINDTWIIGEANTFSKTRLNIPNRNLYTNVTLLYWKIWNAKGISLPGGFCLIDIDSILKPSKYHVRRTSSLTW